jgi:phenylalanyl-tRNA synthetase beta chain
VRIDGEPAGWLGELHPRWQQKYELPQHVVLFELDAAALAAAPLPRPTQPSRFPPVVRDIALLVDAGVPAQALLDAAEAEKQAIVQGVGIFDLYQGSTLPAGKKSLAFRVVMQDTERTLTDMEADSARDALIALWGRRFGAILRS